MSAAHTGRWWLAALALVSMGAAALVASGRWTVPERHNPWAPLDIVATPNWLTRHKLARLAGDPALCRAVLARGGVVAEALPDRDTGPGCGFHGAVRIARLQARLDQPLPLACPAAAALAVWERHVLQPAAEQRLGSAVARIDTAGSYACRNVYGREQGARSEHATANAIDITGVLLRDGRRIGVGRDWGRAGSAEAGFLQQAHEGACRFFGAVLGPAYNAAHADHLHLDRGRWRTCR